MSIYCLPQVFTVATWINLAVSGVGNPFISNRYSYRHIALKKNGNF